MPLHPASYWTHAKGQQSIDFVGKIENFEVEVERLCTLLGIPPPAAENANVTDTLQDPSLLNYRSVSRMSRPAIDRINRLFSDDFATFGYEQV
jgi:hypothetical protein